MHPLIPIAGVGVAGVAAWLAFRKVKPYVPPPPPPMPRTPPPPKQTVERLISSGMLRSESPYAVTHASALIEAAQGWKPGPGTGKHTEVGVTERGWVDEYTAASPVWCPAGYQLVARPGPANIRFKRPATPGWELLSPDYDRDEKAIIIYGERPVPSEGWWAQVRADCVPCKAPDEAIRHPTTGKSVCFRRGT